MMHGIVAAAAAHQPLARRRRETCRTASAADQTVKATRVAAPSAGAQSAEAAVGQRLEMLAVERLRRRQREIGIGLQLGQHGRTTAGRSCASAPSTSSGVPVWRSAQSSEQRIAGPGVEGDQRAVVSDPGDVADAAEIEHGDRLRQSAARARDGRPAPTARPARRRSRRRCGSRSPRRCRSASPAARRRRSARSAAGPARGGWSGRGSRRPRSRTACARPPPAAAGPRRRGARSARAPPPPPDPCRRSRTAAGRGKHVIGARSAGAEIVDRRAVGVDQGGVDAVARGAAHHADRPHRALAFCPGSHGIPPVYALPTDVLHHRPPKAKPSPVNHVHAEIRIPQGHPGPGLPASMHRLGGAGRPDGEAVGRRLYRLRRDGGSACMSAAWCRSCCCAGCSRPGTSRSC